MDLQIAMVKREEAAQNCIIIRNALQTVPQNMPWKSYPLSIIIYTAAGNTEKQRADTRRGATQNLREEPI